MNYKQSSTSDKLITSEHCPVCGEIKTTAGCKCEIANQVAEGISEPLGITKKTHDFRIKRNSVFQQVLQQWNRYVDKDGGFWTDVPIVYTDDDKDFERP